MIVALSATGIRADSISTGYDINRLLNQGHPFAHRTGTKWRPAATPSAGASTASVGTPSAYTPPQAGSASERTTQSPAMPAPINPMPSATRPSQPEPTPETAEASSVWRETTARAGARGKPLGGVISEISLGVLKHDQGPFTDTKEDGINAHIEIRFKSPDFLDIIWGPEPHIGANFNSKGDTSQVFAGLSYEWLIWKGLFAGISVGGAYHNGETDSHLVDNKDLGCKLLFRESLTLGWEITEHHKIAAIFDHISNAKICDFNEGLENFGVRYSYRF